MSVAIQSATQSVQRLDGIVARSLPSRTSIVVHDATTGEVVERLRLLRYAGHYRADGVHAFAVRDEAGKYHVRSDRELGLADDSPYFAYVEGVVDLTDGAGGHAA